MSSNGYRAVVFRFNAARAIWMTRSVMRIRGVAWVVHARERYRQRRAFRGRMPTCAGDGSARGFDLTIGFVRPGTNT